jgi:hypothetical protein
MYIGIGTIVVIVIIVLLVLMLRRRLCSATAMAPTSENPDVLGLGPLVAADGGVLDALVVFETAVTVSLDRGVMDEYVRRSVVGDDETISLVRVEPFHCSLSHCAVLPERSSGFTAVHPGLRGRLSLVGRRGLESTAPAVRIRRRCGTSTNFDDNHSHLTPSRPPIRHCEDNRSGTNSADRPVPRADHALGHRSVRV